MKKVRLTLICLGAIGSASVAFAADLAGSNSYYGTIDAVAPGFFDHTGVSLPAGTTCRGRSEVVLLTSNPRYVDILSLLITAQASRSKIKLHAPANQPAFNGYCTIGEAAIGNFAPW